MRSSTTGTASRLKINRLGRTIWRWRAQISSWHAAHVANAPTGAANNLINPDRSRVSALMVFASAEKPL